MFFNKLKSSTIATVPYFMARKFVKDKIKIDMFVYSSGIESNNVANSKLVLVKRDIYLNQHIWSRKNKSLFNQSKPIRVYPDLNIHDFSNSFFTTENLIPPLKNTFILDEVGLKNNGTKTEIDNPTTTSNDKEQKSNLLLFKKIEQVEKIYKKDNPVSHFFTDHYYFDNKLQNIQDNNGDDKKENNIFFVDSTKIINKCSHCQSGKIKELEENEKNKLKEANYFTSILKDGNISFKLNVDTLVKCKKCTIVMDKQINELINMQRKAESVITKSKFYYLPHTLLLFYLWNNEDLLVFIISFLYNFILPLIFLPTAPVFLLIDLIYYIYSFLEKK